MDSTNNMSHRTPPAPPTDPIEQIERNNAAMTAAYLNLIDHVTYSGMHGYEDKITTNFGDILSSYMNASTSNATLLEMLKNEQRFDRSQILSSSFNVKAMQESMNSTNANYLLVKKENIELTRKLAELQKFF